MHSTASPTTPAPGRVALELFLVSVLILFLELACIRWFPAHVLFLTFFTNIVLLACFLGMSLGCIAARQRRNYLRWTPWLLLLAIGAAIGVEHLRFALGRVVSLAREPSPQLVFFGTELPDQDVASFVVPLEAVAGFFFVVLALALVGPGQEMGRAFNRLPNRVAAYTVNILGSLVGIGLFGLLSWYQLSPFWWFLPIAVGLAYFLFPRPATGRSLLRWSGVLGLLLLTTCLAGLRAGAHAVPPSSAGNYLREWAQALFVPGSTPVPAEAPQVRHLWSPYYRVDYDNTRGMIEANLIGHQVMIGTDQPIAAYALPHELNRDAGRPPYRDVLIIGAGSGNDVSRALQWGAEHVDAVEIDPVIQGIGKEHHPDRPYSDPRVTVHLNDGRNYLRSCTRKYDLVVYAVIDSLVLHSSYSNIRLESYLYTREAFQDVQRCLKPGGLFAMYNHFRYGWLVARLHEGLKQAFGADNPLVLTIPYMSQVHPEAPFDGSTLFLAGDTAPIREAFARQPAYWRPDREVPLPDSANGFTTPTEEERQRWLALPPRVRDRTPWSRFGPATVLPAATPIGAATDDWPFLYLREPMVPKQSLRGMAVLACLALVLLAWFTRPQRRGAGRWVPEGRMFFLGAAFLLIETKAVVHMALLFGSTWMVNSVVFAAVLVMILLANLFVLARRPQRLGLYYAGLLATLALNSVIPLDFFLGLGRAAQMVGACLLVFTPIWFAGVIFAVSFAQSAEPDRAMGANIAGAMVGGLAENASMLLGFRHLVLLAMAFYLLSLVRLRSPAPPPVVPDGAHDDALRTERVPSGVA